MDKAVYYCCVAKGGKLIHAYSGGDVEVEKLAALCVENAPPYHRWYAQTMGRKTYGFLMEDGLVYFAIADVDIGNPRLLRFLEHFKDEFKNITKRNRGLGLNLKGSGGNFSNLSSNLHPIGLQDQLVPVIHKLITSLQNVSRTGDHGLLPSSSPANYEIEPHEGFEIVTSTKAPLLGKIPCKQERKTMKDIEFEEHRKSADKICRGDSGSSNQSKSVAVTVNPTPLQKEMSGSMRRRSSSQAARGKWRRLVQLVLVIDAAVCIILFLVWLLVCQGLQCVQ